jgi:tyrosine-protein kinase Etk/Wzc
MNDFQNIKKLLLPAIKRSPIIIGIFILAILLASRAVIYQAPMYESTAKIKLDDNSTGFSNTNLYKDFDVFSTKQKIMTEVEVLKSKQLMLLSLVKLDFDISYFRIGKIRTAEMYHKSPFLVAYKIHDPQAYDKDFNLQILNRQNYLLNYTIDGQVFNVDGTFGQLAENEYLSLNIKLNDSLLKSKNDLSIADMYLFRIYSKSALVSKVKTNLDIKEVDKDIAVIRISYKSEVPEKAERLVNTLAETYMNDYVATKIGAAGKTLDFIEGRIAEVSQTLATSEEKLERYKLDNDVVNTFQETETGLRAISQVQIQLNNLEIREATLDSLNKYINESGRSFFELAPQVAFGDLLFTELVKTMKLYQSEKEDLLLLYTAQNKKVLAIDRKIADLVGYIKESIKNSKVEISIQRVALDKKFKKSSVAFENFPTREKEMLILERDFKLNQNIYNFLMEKRTESAIAVAATISFHRVLEFGDLPKSPVSPNKKLIIIVGGFLGLLSGIFLVYLFEYITARVKTRQDLEKHSATPILGVVPEFRKKTKQIEIEEAFSSVATNLNLNENTGSSQMILVTSSVRGEGKSFIAHHLAKSYSAMGWKVALVDFNMRAPVLQGFFEQKAEKGLAEMIDGTATLEDVLVHGADKKIKFIGAGKLNVPVATLLGSRNFSNVIEDIKSGFDLVVVDTPATVYAFDAIRLMAHADVSIFVVRAGFTKSQYLLNSDMIAEEHKIENLKLLLNTAHRASNYNGAFTGSNFTYDDQYKGVVGRLKRYIKYYL